MPHHSTDENTTSGLTDIVAQHSKDSNASDHPLHDENKGAVETGQVKEAVSSNKGPQIPDGDLPDAKGKEELKAKAAELNK